MLPYPILAARPFCGLSTCLLAFGLALAGGTTRAADWAVYPDESWTRRQPEEAGLDEAVLHEFRQHVGGRGCIVRDGYLVYSWGDIARRGDVASAAKPWYTHFLLLAVEHGRVEGFDEPVVRWEPRLANLNSGLGFKDRLITWRNLANQTACYQLSEPPGTAFAYNDWQMALFWDTLFLKVYGATYDTVDQSVLHPLLTEQLGCEDEPTFLAFGRNDRPGRLAVSPRDFARFGLLYLRQGKWDDRQLLGSRYVTMALTDPLPLAIPRTSGSAAEMLPGQRSIGSTKVPDDQTDHFGSYSWLWWVNGVGRDGERLWPDAPHDIVAALGHSGRRGMWIIPSLDLVVSYNDSSMETWTGRESEVNRAMQLLGSAVID